MLIKKSDLAQLAGVTAQTINDLLNHRTISANELGLINTDDIKTKKYLEKKAIDVTKIKTKEDLEVTEENEPVLIKKQKVELEIKITQLASEKIKLAKLRNEFISREFCENIIFNYLSNLSTEIESRGEEIISSVIDASISQKGREAKISKAKILFKKDLKKIIKSTKTAVEKLIDERGYDSDARH